MLYLQVCSGTFFNNIANYKMLSAFQNQKKKGDEKATAFCMYAYKFTNINFNLCYLFPCYGCRRLL